MDQPLGEITTDEDDAEIPAPAAGVMEVLLVAEGGEVVRPLLRRVSLG